MTTPIDARRLADGARALGLPTPTTVEEIREQLPILFDGMLALQSLDDLGEEANTRAWNDMLELQRRYDAMKAKLKETP